VVLKCHRVEQVMGRRNLEAKRRRRVERNRINVYSIAKVGRKEGGFQRTKDKQKPSETEPQRHSWALGATCSTFT